METSEIDPKTLIGKMFVFMDEGKIAKAFLIHGIYGESFIVDQLGKSYMTLTFLIQNLLHFFKHDKINPEYYHIHGYHLIEGKEYEYFSS